MISRRAWRLTLWFVLIAAATLWLMTNVRLQTQLYAFFPSQDKLGDAWLMEELAQGPATRMLILALDGGTLNERIHVSQDLKQTLKEIPGIRSVTNGELDLDGLLVEPLIDRRFMLSSEIKTGWLTTESLSSALEQRLDELAMPFPTPFKTLINRDPMGIYQDLLADWQPQSSPSKTSGLWSSADGESLFLIVETTSDSWQLAQQQTVLNSIEQAFINLTLSDQIQLTISGPAAFATESKRIVEAQTAHFSMLASIGLIMLLLIAYRNPMAPLLAAIPLASGLLAGAFFTALIFGELHGITLAFGITLLGVTIDYPIHFFSHRGSSPPRQAMNLIWPTIRLGMLTTGLAYLTFVTTNMIGLQQLGLFSCSGLLIAGLVNHWLMPELVSSEKQLGLTGLVPVRAVLRYDKSLIWLPVALLIALSIHAFQSEHPLWQDDLAQLSPVPIEMIDVDRELRRQLKAPEGNQMIILRGTELEDLLQKGENLMTLLHDLVQQGIMDDFDLLTEYLPSRATQMKRRVALPTPEEAELIIKAAVVGTPFRAELFDDFVADIRQAQSISPLSPEDLTDGPLSLKLKQLLRKQPDGWRLNITLSEVHQPERLAAELYRAAPDAVYVNLRDMSRRMITDFREQILLRISLGIGLMFLILLMGLGSIKLAVNALIPPLLAAILTFLVIYASGISLSIFHLIALILVLGIGMDYSLFFRRSHADLNDQARIGHALTVCTMSTLIVFAMLALAAMPVLQAIGFTVSIGVVIALLTGYAFRKHPNAV